MKQVCKNIFPALILGFSLLLRPALAEEQQVTPSDVYVKVQQLNEGLVSLLRQKSTSRYAIQLNREVLKNQIRPRHVYQMVLDIELKLTEVMRANGVEAPRTNLISVRPYAPRDVSNLLEKLRSRIDRLLAYYQAEKSTPNAPPVSPREPVDVFYSLERMERFLLKMGAPATQPGHVLRRAVAIAYVAEKLCKLPSCQNIVRKDVHVQDLIIPVHVYQETYRFINALHFFVKKYNIDLPGGVVVLRPEKEMITPAQVNKLMGIALADTIGVAQYGADLKEVELPVFNPEAFPRHVWREINYARRLIAVMNAE